MPFFVNYIGVCTGWGATGTWVIDDQGDPSYGQQGFQPQLDARGGFGCAPCWVPANNGMSIRNTFILSNNVTLFHALFGISASQVHSHRIQSKVAKMAVNQSMWHGE